MPNIFKRFLQPNASDFVFPDVEELVEEEPADTAGEQEGEPEESAPEAEEKDTPSAVDFAQIQAEKILEDARRQAEDYLVRRQMEAEQEAEQVRQQAQSEGYRQGYAEGLRQAGVEGQAELQKQREQQAEELQAFLEKATAAREELLRETRGELCELSLAIAEKVIHVSLNSSSEVVARMIQWPPKSSSGGSGCTSTWRLCRQGGVCHYAGADDGSGRPVRPHQNHSAVRR